MSQTFTTLTTGIVDRNDGTILARLWRGAKPGSKAFRVRDYKNKRECIAAAKAWRTEAFAKRNRGEEQEPRARLFVTLTDECHDWLDYMQAHEVVERSTWLGYRAVINSTIAPTLGKLHCHEVTRRAVEEWITALMRKGTDPRRIRHAKNIVVRVLDRAIDRGIITGHGIASVRVRSPRASARPSYIPAPDHDTVVAIIDAIRPRWRIVAQLAYDAGLRFGEAAGLRPCDVVRDDDGWWLMIEQQVPKVGNVRKPKNQKTRRVPATPELVMLLRAHEAEYGLSVDGCYVSAPEGGRIYYEEWRREWLRVKAELGHSLKGVHMLRHGYASHHAEREPLAAVQGWLGHAQLSTTTDYYVKATTNARPGTSPLRANGNRKAKPGQRKVNGAGHTD